MAKIYNGALLLVNKHKIWTGMGWAGLAGLLGWVWAGLGMGWLGKLDWSAGYGLAGLAGRLIG